MNLDKIVNKAFKEARRKISNSELASRCMEYNYPVELQLSVIRENFMDSFVIYSVKLLQEKHSKYECPDSKQYLELIKVMLFKGVYLMDAIYTDLQHVREDVHNVITSYSNDPTHDEILDPLWYVM